MSKKADDLPYWPAALRLDQAAIYCGLSPDTFKKVCPVRPIEFTASARGRRYLRFSLDRWLQSLDLNPGEAPRRRIGERIKVADTETTRRRRRTRGKPPVSGT